jgi:serine/threonine-protein kinase
MALIAGTRIGAYDVIAPLGAGGMGEVYRARDTKLGREVALKILPEAFAFDADRVARFEREAKILASLNHPHIAALHGMEVAGDRHVLIMELVEGETLADRLSRGALPVDQALRIAIQIAEALEDAHERGVVHRDLKPANVKITPDDKVKVLDFGLARTLDCGAGGSIDVTHSPTIGVAGTQAGIILGTAPYMSPEQAKGSPADHRSDVFSFGSVLYEMLAGQRAFHGVTTPEVLASVLAREPAFTALPDELHPRLIELLKRCLEKNPKRRWQAVGDLRAELEAVAAAPGETGGTAVPRTSPGWRRAVLHAAIAFTAAVVSGVVVWYGTRPAPSRLTRLTVLPPARAGLSVDGVVPDLTISPDGSRVIYVGGNGRQIFVRPLDVLEPVPIYEGAPRNPTVSPDGQWVAFTDSNTSILRVTMNGGPALTLTSTDGGGPRGLAWPTDDTLIFATNATATGLQRVSLDGGATVLTRPDRASGEIDHLWPEALPGGQAVLFTITRAGGIDASQIAVLDLQAGTYKVVLRGGSHARYAPTGHLVYGTGGSLLAVPFDLDRLEANGTPVPLGMEIVTTGLGAVDVAVAADGTLAYLSGGAAAGLQRVLVWIDREGRETTIPTPPRAYAYPRISPDGSRAAVWANDQDNDIWLWDFARNTLTRMTFDPGLDLWPVWARDARRLIFASERSGTRNVYWQVADGTGDIERLTDSPNVQYPSSVTPDGRRLFFAQTGDRTAEDIMQVDLDGTNRVLPVVQTPFTERNASVSPDGRWLVYEANDSGRFEIYVRPFPDVNSGRWQVSSGGGTRPLWARDGRELFFLSPAGDLLRIGVDRAAASWTVTPPSVLVKAGYITVPAGNPGLSYDVSPDGERFLMVKAGTGSVESPALPSIVIVQGWAQELNRLVPGR